MRILLFGSALSHRPVPSPRGECSFDEAGFYVRSHVDRAHNRDEYRHKEGDQNAGHENDQSIPHSVSFHLLFTERSFARGKGLTGYRVGRAATTIESVHIAEAIYY
jgi:hypothetical protein